jgi:hypothetical protein
LNKKFIAPWQHTEFSLSKKSTIINGKKVGFNPPRPSLPGAWRHANPEMMKFPSF